MVLLAIGATDAHASITDGTVAPTVLARAGTGGGNEPIVLIGVKHETNRIRCVPASQLETE